MNEETTEEYYAGRPDKLTPENHKLIVHHVRLSLSITNAARIARLSPQTPLDWMTRAKKDQLKGITSKYTTFLDDMREAQGLKISDMIATIERMPKAWQAISWLLEKCCAEDFGKDSELYKQLLEDYKMLMQSLIDNQKGNNHGRKEEKLD